MTCIAILFVLLLVGFVGLACAGVLLGRTLERLRLLVHNALSGSHFTPSLCYCSDAVDAGLAIDEERRRVCLWQLASESETQYKYRFRVFDFADVLEAELAEDGTLLSKSSVASQATGTVAGGKERTVKTLELRLTVNDMEEPQHRVVFYRSLWGTSTEKPGYKAKLEQASLWLQRMTVAMRQGPEQGNGYPAQPDEPREWALEVAGSAVGKRAGEWTASLVVTGILISGMVLFVWWAKNDLDQRRTGRPESSTIPLGHGYEVRREYLHQFARERGISTERAKELLLQAKLFDEAAKKIKEGGE